MPKLTPNQLDAAKKILLVCVAKDSIDIIGSTFALYHTLTAAGKEVALWLGQDSYPQEIASKFSGDNVDIYAPGKDGDYVISLNNVATKVRNVNWKEEQGKVNIYITMDDGSISKDGITLSHQDVSMDLTIVVGLDHLHPLKDMYLAHKTLFRPESTLLISRKAPPAELAGFWYDVKTDSVVEGVVEFLKEYQIAVPPIGATYLLGALYWVTNSFANCDGQLPLAAALVNLKADTRQAQTIGLQTLSFAQSQLLKKIYENCTSAGDGLFYATISKEELLLNKSEPFLIPSLAILSTIIGCKIAFVLLEDESRTRAFIESMGCQVDITPLLAKYKGTGTGFSGNFSSTMPIKQIEQQLIADCKQVLGISLPLTVEPAQQPTSRPIVAAPIQPEQPVKPLSATTPVIDAPPKQPAPVPSKRTAQQPIMEKPEPPVDAEEIKPTIVDGDPLAPATNIPKPLILDGDKIKIEDDFMPAAPATPLPPASI